MSLYKKFGNDDALETEGAYLEIEGAVRIRMARAGGKNRAFLAAAEAEQKKHQRAINNDLLSTERGVEIAQALYARTLVKEWFSWDDEKGEWIEGIETPDGSIVPMTPDVVQATWKALPDLWVQCYEFTNSKLYFNRSYIDGMVKK